MNTLLERGILIKVPDQLISRIFLYHASTENEEIGFNLAIYQSRCKLTPSGDLAVCFVRH